MYWYIIYNYCVHIPKTDATTSKELSQAAVTATQPKQSKIALRNKPKEKPGISPNKKAEFRQSGRGTESPVPKRAKFVKKLSTPKAPVYDKKKPTKMSKTKLTTEYRKAKKSEQNSKKDITISPSGQKMPTKQRKVSTEKKSQLKMVSKPKKNQAHKQKQVISSKNSVASDLQTLKLEGSNSNKISCKDAQFQLSGVLENPPSSYEIVADALAEKLVKEAVALQGKL